MSTATKSRRPKQAADDEAEASAPVPAEPLVHADLTAVLLEEVRQLRRQVEELSTVNRPGPIVRDIINAYLGHAQRKICKAAYGDSKRQLEDLAQALGEKPVSACGPTDLVKWMDGHAAWVSGWTRKGVLQVVQCCFNWARKMRLIPENPFAGVALAAGEPQRPLTEAEYRAILRHAGARFRRILIFLWLTGCRPGELRALRWADLHLGAQPDQGIYRGWIILKKHKTAKKTHKPRKIPLVPAVVKLLLWLRRRQECPVPETVQEWLLQALAAGPLPARDVMARARQAWGCSATSVYSARGRAGIQVFQQSAAPGRGRRYWQLPAKRRDHAAFPDDAALAWLTNWLARLLAKGKVQVCEVTRQATGQSISPKALRKAKQALGVLETRDGRGGVGWWRLPDPQDRAAQVLAGRGGADSSEFVFRNSEGNPWTKNALAGQLARIRDKAGVARDAKLYGCRHAFGTSAIIRGVDVLTLSKLMGHESVAMTQHYVHLAEQPEYLEQAMRKATGQQA